MNKLIPNKELLQDKNSHKFSTDALLLAEFCPLEKVKLLAELGTGCGIISLELLEKKKDLKAIALDFNINLLDTAKENAKIYNVEDRIEFILEDFNKFPKFNSPIKNYNNICDLVVCNPPWLYENQGKLPKEEMKKKALFGDKETYTVFFNTAKYLLKERGLLCFISIPNRIEDIFASLKKTNFVMKKMQFVYKDCSSPAIFVMALAEYRGKEAKDHLSDMVVLEGKYL